MERPPEHVLAAFGLSGVRPVPLGSSWEGGWRCGEVVMSMVPEHARAAWSAKVRESLFVDGVRLARPVRSTDGRYVVAGWRADTFVAGTPEPRHDEVVSAAVRLHEATANLERPRFLTQPPVAPWADVDVSSPLPGREKAAVAAAAGRRRGLPGEPRARYPPQGRAPAAHRLGHPGQLSTSTTETRPGAVSVACGQPTAARAVRRSHAGRRHRRAAGV
ncbi:hypothetical protein BN970_00796 [Mycolicibacterium conceptionense]|uniref:Aminoglycoside phosphotransferase n=1 Tax=Mycolicibacterium conceptionense TaxID=451644 RepID=A0A0U1CYK7_9MYCO|nr:hypothetical protein BN970_00796 [Mycolicibacterium conceptionense]